MYQVCAIARNVREFAGGCFAACPLFTVNKLVRRPRREARFDLRGAAQQVASAEHRAAGLIHIQKFIIGSIRDIDSGIEPLEHGDEALIGMGQSHPQPRQQ